MYYFSCPKCGSDSAFFRLQEDGGGLDSTGCAILVFGGLLPALIYSAVQKERIQCGTCGAVFPKPALPKSPVARTLFWMWFLIPLAVLLGLNAESLSLRNAAFPGKGVVLAMEAMLEGHMFACAFALVCFVVLMTLVCLGVGIAANVRFRRRIRAEYDTEPTDYRAPSADLSRQ